MDVQISNWITWQDRKLLNESQWTVGRMSRDEIKTFLIVSIRHQFSILILDVTEKFFFISFIGKRICQIHRSVLVLYSYKTKTDFHSEWWIWTIMFLSNFISISNFKVKNCFSNFFPIFHINKVIPRQILLFCNEINIDIHIIGIERISCYQSQQLVAECGLILINHNKFTILVYIFSIVFFCFFHIFKLSQTDHIQMIYW